MRGPKLPIPFGNLVAWLGGILAGAAAVALLLLLGLPLVGWLVAAALAMVVLVSCFASTTVRERVWAVCDRLIGFSRWWH